MDERWESSSSTTQVTLVNSVFEGGVSLLSFLSLSPSSEIESDTLPMNSELGQVLRNHYQAFAIVASLTKSNAGPVVLLPTSELGLEAWNAARRPSKSVIKRVFEGGRGSNRYASGMGSSESSDAELDLNDDSATITPTNSNRNRSGSGGLSSLMSGRRSRSNTVSATQTIVVDSGVRGEETRRIAGAGAGDGLGRGLLSYVSSPLSRHSFRSP